MTDNHIVPTREELMQGVTLDYAPFYSVFKARAHEAKIENVKFKTIRAEDDIVAAFINAQDTERKHVKATAGDKSYAKAFKGVQYAESILNAQSALPDMNNRVLKAFHKQLDKEIWLGKDNNGVIVSSDPFHITNASVALPKTISGNNGIDALVALATDLQKQVEVTSSSSNFQLAFYGDAAKKYLRKTLTNGTAYNRILADALKNVAFLEVPANLAETESGIVVICPEIVELNHTLLPQVQGTGTDERAGEVWVNYIYGTAMVDVKEMGGLIVQPITVAD